MAWIFAGLLIFSVLLLFISFFMSDPYKEIREEIDELSMQQMKEIYQIKKKLKIIEEELLMSDEEIGKIIQRNEPPKVKKEINAIIRNQVLLLAEQGLSVDQIAKQSSLTIDDVNRILHDFVQSRGEYDE
jgi:predicted transposase YdaD